MSCATAVWNNFPPITWDPECVWAEYCPEVEKYLFDAFEAAFGIRPVQVMYSEYPDGVYASLVIDAELAVEHNAWAGGVASKMRRSGLKLSVVVRSISEFDPPDEGDRAWDKKVPFWTWLCGGRRRSATQQSQAAPA